MFCVQVLEQLLAECQLRDVLIRYYNVVDLLFYIHVKHLWSCWDGQLLSFFGYKSDFHSFFQKKKIPQNLDLSYKKHKTCIRAKFYTTDLVISSHSRKRETPSYS